MSDADIIPLMQDQSKKIKVLFILSALHKDGAVLSTLTTINHLDRQRFQPQLFVIKELSTGNHGNAWNRLLKDLDIVYGSQSEQKLPALWELFKKLYQQAKRTDIIVGGLEMGPTFLAAFAGKILGKPSVGFIRNSLPDLLTQIPSYYKRLTLLIYPFLTKGIAISNGIKERTEKLIPGLKGKITTVYIPIDIDQIQKLSAIDLPEAKALQPYILAVGRLMPQKGFDILLHAYSIAVKQGVHQRLVIIGEGPDRLMLENLITDLNLTDKVTLAGFQENPYSWMKNADIFVSSSRFEGFCRVLAEAQVIGIPVVSTDCPDGPAEVLEGGRSGVLVQNENPQALADAISELLQDPVKMQQLSIRGAERVQEFTLRAVVGKFESVLENLHSKKIS